VVNKIRHYELFADGRSAKISLRRPDLVIERSKLIQFLAARAEESGAQILTGRRFLSLETNGRQLNFLLSRNRSRWPVEESADILVGADGALSTVAQSASWPRQSSESVFQAIVELPKDVAPDATRVWFVPQNTSYFYWLIPHSPRQGVLGLIGTEERKVRGDLEGFLARNALVPIEFQTASVPRYTYRIPFHRNMKGCHVYLVGDAAGHVKASTVGGLVTGFRGAIAVAEAILNGGSSRQLRALRLELDLHYLVRRGLNCFTLADYVRLLDLLTPSVKRSLSLFNRDDTGRLLCHVFFRQPRLLLLGFRSLLIGQ
jgi:flavin-dependent dehydrogenase